jgi:5-formyltetrahydrofolate cyclo-ligase
MGCGVPDFSGLPRTPADSDRSASPVRTKPEIRDQLVAARRSRSTAERSAADAALSAALVALVGRFQVVCGYAPQPHEPGGTDLPALLGGATGTLLLPVMRNDGDLDWTAYTGELRPARYGLREPVGPRLGPGAIATAGLVLVPALAVDRTGVRLGRGGGYYDRALSRAAPTALVLAVLYDGELVDALPAQPHDRPVHGVVTPAGVVLLTRDASALDETASDAAPLALEE